MKSVTVNEDDWEERIIADVKCPYCKEWQEVETFWEFETIKWTCDKCPALIIESNENVYPPEFHCWYGDKYRDEHLEYLANLNEGCRKHLTTIERDMFGVENDKKINK